MKILKIHSISDKIGGFDSGTSDASRLVVMLHCDNVIAERFKFHSAKQTEWQSTLAFTIKLRKQAIRCAFGYSLGEDLRDQLVLGVSNDDTRKR